MEKIRAASWARSIDFKWKKMAESWHNPFLWITSPGQGLNRYRNMISTQSIFYFLLPGRPVWNPCVQLYKTNCQRCIQPQQWCHFERFTHTLLQLYWQKFSKDTIEGPSSVRGDVGHFTLTSEKVSIASKKTDKSIRLSSLVNSSTISHLDLVLWVWWNHDWLLCLSFFYWTYAVSDICLCPFLHSEMKKWKYTSACAFC